jgi:aminoglycoside phosphotransferase (APT) family kinase protein
MDFTPIKREPGSFQESVSADQILAMSRRIFGEDVKVGSAVELGNGMYNNTYRVEIDSEGPVILRVAPEPERQFRSERELMRAEYDSVPYLAPIASLIPKTLGADFTHDLIGRDYLFQTLLAGIPGPQALGKYDRSMWRLVFRQLGEITRSIHSVHGEGFGALRGSRFATWSEALLFLLRQIADDIDSVGLESSDLRLVAALAEKDRDVLDEITQPSLLHGDLWTVNVMLAADTPEPTITGVFDNDRTSWGDPASDWAIQMAGKKPGTERDAFWETYGQLSDTPGRQIRELFYQARHVAAVRLERHRLGNHSAVPETYEQMREVIARLHR